MNRSKYRALAQALFTLAVTPIVAGCFTLEFSPDGKKLVFLWAHQTEDKAGGMAIANSDGSDLRMLTGPKDPNFGHWSPDSSKVLYSGESGLWLFNTSNNSTQHIWPKESGDSCWVSDTKIVFETLEKTNEGDKSKLIWYDLEKKLAYQEVAFEASRDVSMNITPVPRTDGVVLMNSSNLMLAEFGESKQLTTTGDVLGFAVDAEKDRILFARSTKNPQFILMTLWEYDLRLRSVRKLPLAEHVLGINPKPRTGPSEIRYVKFSRDLQNMLIFAVPDTAMKNRVLIFQDLYWMDIAGNQGKKLVSIYPSNEATGLMAAISPDSNSVAVLYGDKTSITLSSFDVETGAKRVLKRIHGTKL